MNEKSYIKIGKNIKKLVLENNRAIFGDAVAVELLPFDTWKTTVKTIEEQNQ